jgi:hypothetical protein
MIADKINDGHNGCNHYLAKRPNYINELKFFLLRFWDLGWSLLGSIPIDDVKKGLFPCQTVEGFAFRGILIKLLCC